MSNADSETVTVSETGLGRYQVLARAGGSTLLVDDLLAAALGACTTMTIRFYANHKGWPLRRVEMAVRHSREALSARDRFELDIALDGELTAEQRARILEIAERCPVHLTLARGSDVAARLLAADEAEAIRPSDGTAHTKCMREACAD